MTKQQSQEICGQVLGIAVSTSSSHHHHMFLHPMLYQSHLKALSVNASPSNIGPIKAQGLNNVNVPWSWPTVWKQLCYKTITWFSQSGPDNSSVIVILWKTVLTSQSFSKSSISLDPPCKPILLAGQLLLSCFHREMRKLRSWFKFSELAVGRTGIQKSVFLCSLHSCPLLSTTLTFNSGCLYAQLSMFLLTVLLTIF